MPNPEPLGGSKGQRLENAQDHYHEDNDLQGLKSHWAALAEAMGVRHLWEKDAFVTIGVVEASQIGGSNGRMRLLSCLLDAQH